MHFVICSVASVHMEITEQNKASRIFCHLHYREQSEDGLEPIPGGASCSPFLCKPLGFKFFLGQGVMSSRTTLQSPGNCASRTGRAFPLHNQQ